MIRMIRQKDTGHEKKRKSTKLYLLRGHCFCRFEFLCALSGDGGYGIAFSGVFYGKYHAGVDFAKDKAFESMCAGKCAFNRIFDFDGAQCQFVFLEFGKCAGLEDHFGKHADCHCA